MSNPRANEDAILSPAALANENKVSGVKEFFVEKAKHLLTLIGFFIKHPARLYLNYHKTHFEMLLRVLIAVRKAEPIEKQIKEMEENIRNYKDETSVLVAEINKVPPSPWSDMNPFLLIVLLQSLKNNPTFVRAYNANLDAYDNLVQKALESSEACVDAGRQIESNTPQKIEELYEEIEKLSASGSIGITIKQSYINRLQFIDLYLVTTIQQWRGAAENSVKYLNACWDKVRKADRL